MDLKDEIFDLLRTTYAAEIESGELTLLDVGANTDTDKYQRIIVGVNYAIL